LLVQEGRIEDALTLALELDRPGQMRQILSNYTMDVVAQRLDKEDGAKDPGTRKELDLRRWVGSLQGKQLEQFVAVLEQWNSNRRMSPLAQMFLGFVLTALPAEKLTAVEGMNATCEGLLSYSLRHQARIDALLQKTFVFDLVLQSSGMGLSLMDEFQAGEKGPSALGAGAMGHDASGVAAAMQATHRRAEDALRQTMEVLHGGEGEKEAEIASDSDDNFVAVPRGAGEEPKARARAAAGAGSREKRARTAA